MSTSQLRARARSSVTVLVTLGIIGAEFLFLSWLTRLDDGADELQRAQSTAAVALQVWTPGTDRSPVVSALDALARSDVSAPDALRRDTRAWSATGDDADLSRLRQDVAAAGDEAGRAQTRVEVEVSLILVGVLLFVSVGWFVWFRRLVARHRAVEHELTQQKAVDTSERRLLALVQNSADVVAVLRADSTAMFVSPAVSRVLGRPAESLVDRPLIDLLAAEDRPMLQQLLLTQGTEHEVKVGMQHGDGRDLVMEGSLVDLTADPAVEGWVLTLRDVTERQRMQDDLTRQAFHDSLTGLANRQLFSDRLGHALARGSHARPRPLAVLFVDLDDFKNVNDSLGHQVGDGLLQAVGERISCAIRPGDTAARLGGDEFAVLLEDTDLTTASQVAHRLLAALVDPIELEHHTHIVRASVGLTTAVPGKSDAADVLRHADVAMYMAKERGKGDIAVYDSEWHQRALETMTLRQELEVALSSEQLYLHYQPTVDLETQRITGFEALVRWHHPTRGNLPPLEFIALAEQTGQIVKLGTWVLRAATRDAASMQTADHTPTVAVNVAAKQLTHPDFAETVRSALAESGLPADRLVVEITETALLEDLDLGAAVLAELRADGIRVAIDDFGTGYSSLSHLAQLPVDVLKVDKSFIDRLGKDVGDPMVSAILAMSRGLQLTSVAEGVEDPAQAAWLREANCSLGQGYLWSRPVDLETARGLLDGSATTPAEAPVTSETAETVKAKDGAAA